MIRAVLFDLDDTLLSNNMGRFLPAYLQLISTALADHLPPERTVAELLRGTKAMLDNHDPEKTLQQVFGEVFYPALGADEQSLAPHFEAFYRGRFEELRALTSPCSQAGAVVHAVAASGRAVAIATNPMMPRLAVLARLRWAGVPSGMIPYAAIASFERFHFAKPDPAYLAEMTGRIGVAPQEAAMVGNDPQEDIAPARLLGMPTYLVTSAGSGQGTGRLEGVPDWIASLEAGAPAAVDTAEAVAARLRGYLAAFRHLLADLASDSWTASPSPDAWCATEILCHLRDVEREINLPRLQTMIAQDEPFLVAPDSDQWAVPRGYRRQSGPNALQEFTSARKELLSRLPSLDSVLWERKAWHAVLGPTRLRELLAIVAEHDLLHLQQLLQTVPGLPD